MLVELKSTCPDQTSTSRDCWATFNVLPCWKYGVFAYLYVFVERPEDVVDLILESSTQHLVRFIKYKHLDVAGACEEKNILQRDL